MHNEMYIVYVPTLSKIYLFVIDITLFSFCIFITPRLRIIDLDSRGLKDNNVFEHVTRLKYLETNINK